MAWGLLAKIGTWVITNLPTVVKVAKKTAEVVSKAASIIDTLLEGRKILDEHDKQPASGRRTSTTVERPDVMGSSTYKAKNSELTELQDRLDESKKTLVTVKEENEQDHKRIQLQIDLMELVVSSATFERFANNINLHAANLQIHLQTIQNTSGLLDDVNRQRVAVKALMGTVNHMINVLGVTDKVKKIEGLDIDIKPGAISIYRAYDAFEMTRSLLLQEIDSFSDATQEQLNRVEAIRKAARQLPGVSSKISAWLEKSVEPKLMDASKTALDLKNELSVIPRLEATLRQELENVKQDAL